MQVNRDTLMVGLGVLLICLGAMVSIDLTWKGGGIPITGQSLAVLVVGFVLGRKLGLLVIAIYLIAGLAGLPVFAKGASGIDTVLGGRASDKRRTPASIYSPNHLYHKLLHAPHHSATHPATRPPPPTLSEVKCSMNSTSTN